ncbi:MAG: hypothetical protein U1F36_06950 [Planctomycetota bacterium]
MSARGLGFGQGATLAVEELPLLLRPLQSYRSELGLPQIDMQRLLDALECGIARDRTVILTWRAQDAPMAGIVAFAILSFGISMSRGGVDLNVEGLWIDRAHRSFGSIRSVWAEIRHHARHRGAVSLAGVVDRRRPGLMALYRRLGCIATDYQLHLALVGEELSEQDRSGRRGE